MQDSYNIQLSKLGLKNWKLVNQDSLTMPSYSFVVISAQENPQAIDELSSLLKLQDGKLKVFKNVSELKKGGIKACCIIHLVNPKKEEYFDGQETGTTVGFYLATTDWGFLRDDLALQQLKQRLLDLKNGILDPAPEVLNRSASYEEEEGESIAIKFVVVTEDPLTPALRMEFERLINEIGPQYSTQYVTTPDDIEWLDEDQGRIGLLNFTGFTIDIRDISDGLFFYAHVSDVQKFLHKEIGANLRIKINEAYNDYANNAEFVIDEYLEVDDITRNFYLSEETLLEHSYDNWFKARLKHREKEQAQLPKTQAPHYQQAQEQAQGQVQNQAPNQAPNQTHNQYQANNQHHQAQPYLGNNQGSQTSQGSASYQKPINFVQGNNNHLNSQPGYHPYSRLGSNMLQQQNKQPVYLFVGINPSNQQQHQVISIYIQNLCPNNNYAVCADYNEANKIITSNGQGYAFSIISFLGDPREAGVKNFGFAISLANWEQLSDSQVQNIIVSLNNIFLAGYMHNYVNLLSR